MILSIETSTEVCSVALGDHGKLISLRENIQGRSHAADLALFVDEVLVEHDLSVSDLDAVAVCSGPGSYTGLRIGAATAKGLCFGASVPLVAVSSLEGLVYNALEDYKAGVLSFSDAALSTESDLSAHTAAVMSPGDFELSDNVVFVSMIDARRMEVYMQVFEVSTGGVSAGLLGGGSAISGVAKVRALTEIEAVIFDDELVLPEVIRGRDVVLLGDGAKKCFPILAAHLSSISSSFLASVRCGEVLSSARGMVEVASARFGKGEFVDVAYWEPRYLKDFVVTTVPRKLF